MAGERFAQRYYDLRHSTLMFWLLSMATFGIFTCIWLWRFVNRVTPQNSTLRLLALIAIGCMYWYFPLSLWSAQLVVTGAFYLSEGIMAFGSFLGIIAGVASLASIVLLIILSFMTRPLLEAQLAQNGTPAHLNGFLTFIFPFYYQYYCVWNAEERFASQQARPQVAPQGYPQQGYPQQGYQQVSYPQQGQQPYPPQGQQPNFTPQPGQNMQQPPMPGQTAPQPPMPGQVPPQPGMQPPSARRMDQPHS